jgi:hypothetical protein
MVVRPGQRCKPDDRRTRKGFNTALPALFTYSYRRAGRERLGEKACAALPGKLTKGKVAFFRKGLVIAAGSENALIHDGDVKRVLNRQAGASSALTERADSAEPAGERNKR